MCDDNVVTIQLGQCGNQVGSTLFHSLANECQQETNQLEWKTHIFPSVAYPASSRSSFNCALRKRFFRYNNKEQLIARTVLIDMEPKVIQRALHSAESGGLYSYSPNSYFYRQSGSANNWAYGYTVHAPQCKTQIIEIIRKEVTGYTFILLTVIGSLPVQIMLFVSRL